MRVCRYNEDKLGLVRGDQLIDVTAALDVIPPPSWLKTPGDAMIANLKRIKLEIEANRKMGYVQGVKNVTLKSPVANPSKIISAAANYPDYIADPGDDAAINSGRDVKRIEDYGLFLKANSALSGAGEGLTLGYTDRCTGHKIELAMIIGHTATNVPEVDALDYVAGYAIGLDITVGDVGDRSLRNSFDSYAVLGPWITTADEIMDPDDLDFTLSVNKELRQESNTKHLIFGCRQLVSYASNFYTLYPGDILMTGTPRRSGTLKPGDRLECRFDIIGQMELLIRQ